MMFARSAGGAALAVMLLAGCSFSELLEGKKIEYKSAGKLPSLEVPPDLTRPGRDDRYAIPDLNPAGTATFSTYSTERSAQPRPGSTEVLPDVERLRIQRAGSERWLVVPEPPEKLWPLVKEFWQENGLLVKTDMPEVGVMETDWAENRAKIPNDGIRSILGKLIDQVYSTGERDKFRTRLERGADPNTTEIYISHRGMTEVVVNSTRGFENTVWQPREPNPELEAEFLRRLMVKLGADDARAKTALAATPAADRAKLISGNGVGTLELAEPFDRAWRRVGLALDRVGFTVEDRDRSKGYYYVRYADPKEDQPVKKDGILSKLAFWRSDDNRPNAEQYRVLVRGGGAESSEVQVLNKEGAADSSSTAKRILSLLHAQLK